MKKQGDKVAPARKKETRGSTSQAMITLERFMTGRVLSDGGRIYRARLGAVKVPKSEAELRAILNQARDEGRHICIKGAGKSQGGLILNDQAILIDMAGFDQILKIDAAERTARVQAGVTWDALRRALDPLGLSTGSNQSYGVFTVGGSVSVNAHGRNLDTGVLAATVLSIRVMLADGKVVTTSRDDSSELFRLILGGLGLVGIVLDVTLRLSANHIYTKSRVVVMPSGEYPRYFAHVRGDPDVHFHYARLTVEESEVWDRVFCIDYRLDQGGGSVANKNKDDVLGWRDLLVQRMMLRATRRIRWVRRRRFGWEVAYRMRPERCTRNNVAKESFKALESHSRRSVECLQEFFIPVEKFSAFLEKSRLVLREENFRLLNTTIRFVPENRDAMLSYARTAGLALVLFFEQPFGEKALSRNDRILRRLLDCAIDCGGTYYLCYRRFAEPRQLARAYPEIQTFFALKRKYDPGELFSNQFYQHYGRQKINFHSTESSSAPGLAHNNGCNPGKEIDKGGIRRIRLGQRSLRLPQPETFTFTTEDHVELRLIHYRGEGEPLVLAPGMSMSSTVFTLDSVDTNLAEFLWERGHDVWLFEWRSSVGRPSAKHPYTLDDVARFDWPAAVALVRKQSGGRKVHCIVHCIGSQTMLMSLQLGLLDGAVASAVCLQYGLHYEMPVLTQLKAWSRLAEVLDRSGLQSINVSADIRGGVAYRLFDQALRFHPIHATERCDNPTCRRAAFAFGELNRHANLMPETHRRLGEMIGDVSLRPFQQMTRATRNGRIAASTGEDLYFRSMGRLAFPITFIHGEKNGAVGLGSSQRTFELLSRKNDPSLYRYEVISGYGHMDCLIGRDAALEVFPVIGNHLARVGANHISDRKVSA